MKPNNDSATHLPCSGIRVVSFAQLGQGPAAVQMLADYGADVIKIERPGSGAFERSYSGADAFRDGESYFFHSLNRNQRSLTLDLKKAEGLVVAKKLIATADVVVENYRPGVMDRLGLGYDGLREENPRLVYCSSSGYGTVGPCAATPGQDLLMQAFSGLAMATGRRSDPPIPSSSPIVDFHAAALMAFGIMAALFSRNTTGQGQRVETSLLEAAVHLQWEPLFYQLNGWDITERTQNGLGSTFHPGPYGIYPTADGFVAISLMSVAALGRLLDIPALAQVEADDQFEDRETIKSQLENVTRAMTSQELLSALAEADLWAAPVQSYEEFLHHAQTAACQIFDEWPREGAAPIVHLRPPLQMSSAPLDALPRRHAPTLGANNEEVLSEIGYDAQMISRLIDGGVV